MNTSSLSPAKPSRALHVALWVIQVVLAAMFGMAGFMKLTTPIETLSTQLPWVLTTPVALVRFIGAAELAAALGQLLPSLTRIRPSLTPLAAYGLALVMVLAMAFHLSRGEYSALGFNAALLALALFVGWGRSKKAVIEPK